MNTDIYRISTTDGSATWMGEAGGIPYLMLMNGDNYMYGVYIGMGSSDPQPKLMSFDLDSFVDGGTNADGSTHQISIAMVGPGTNFPINFIFSGTVVQPVTNLTVQVSAVGPSDQTACPGSTVVFSTEAGGTGPYNYTWLKNGSTISGQTDSSLTLTNVSDSDAATYSVIVGGEIGGVTNSVTLALNEPVAASSLNDSICWLGGSATFSTVASGTGPFSYVWLKDGIVIPGQNSDSLMLNNVGLSDEATYSVVVSGACGSVTNSATLTIHRGSGDITITVIPALAPNANSSPSWNDWVSNAITALLNGYASCGDPSLPSYYQQVTDAISVTNNIVSVFPSWNSLADPGTVFGANFAGESGNRLHFGFDINGGTNFISIAQLSFVAHSTDTNNTLDFSYAAGSYTYSPSCVGIIYGPGGANIYITSGPATQPVNEIVGRGSGNAWWASADGMPDLASEQSNLNVRASQICSAPFVFVGTYTLGGASGLGQVTFTPALTNAPPLEIDSPVLSIAPAGSGPDSVKVEWSSSADFVLQTNVDLLTSTWGDYHGSVDTMGLTHSATIDTPTRCLFFRLKH